MTNPSQSSTSIKSLPGAPGRRSHGRATLADVAAQAGVTTMTVSRYLRAPAQVAFATAQKISTAIESTGYSPNLQAGSLASGRSQAIAVIVPNIAHSIFADTLHGLGEGLQAAGLQMLVSATSYSLDREEAQLRTVLGWAPAAIVVTGRMHSANALSLLRQAQARGTPVVEIWDRHPAQEQAEFVQLGFNHVEAGAQMASALMQLGGAPRELVYIDSGVAQDFRAHERAQGFMRACAEQGRSAQLIMAEDMEPLQAGRAAFMKWQAEQGTAHAPTAMAFANDLLACGALFAAQSQGWQIPGQLAMLGFGDFTMGRHVHTGEHPGRAAGLSTLRIDGEQIGQACAQHIAQSLSEHTANLQTRTPLAPSPCIRLEPQLCLRSTCY